MVGRGGNGTFDNHCAINRSIRGRWHSVNQFLASKNPRHIQATWFALIVKVILLFSSEEPIWLHVKVLARRWSAGL
jgi:hypothetical protein